MMTIHELVSKHYRGRVIIKTDGTIMPYLGKASTREIAATIGADALDTVTMRDRLHVMLVDDHGWNTRETRSGSTTTIEQTTPRKPVNQIATDLYWEKCGGVVSAKIAGDVVVIRDEEFA